MTGARPYNVIITGVGGQGNVLAARLLGSAALNQDVGRWFDSMGMKPNGKVHAILAASTELVCGILMALGFLTPLAAAGYVSLMIVAGWTVHRANGYRSGIDGWEYNSVLATFAVYVAATSPGAHSIDHALELDFAFKPYTAFAIAVVVGVAGAVGLLAACYRPPAKDEAKG